MKKTTKTMPLSGSSHPQGTRRGSSYGAIRGNRPIINRQNREIDRFVRFSIAE
jgi:hypothetical protein